MTQGEFIHKYTIVLSNVPPPFRDTLYNMAYESGRHGGGEKIISDMTDLVTKLLPAIQEYAREIRTEFLD